MLWFWLISGSPFAASILLVLVLVNSIKYFSINLKHLFMRFAPAFLVLLALTIFGACKSKQMLTKPTNPAPSIEGTYWKLTELMGKPVDAASAPNGREMHLKLVADSTRVTGWGGCNIFGGTYTLQADVSRIRFSKLFSTMMACDRLDLEKQFMDAIERADNYSVADGKLSLNRARMAPLARFEAVAGK